jgi:hypothetical protein
MTEDILENEYYPPQSRFMVTFTSEHKLAPSAPWDTTERWAHQAQRRFFLADSAKQALAQTLKELSSWDANFHRYRNVYSQCVPQAVCWTLGYNRFACDIRISKN